MLTPAGRRSNPIVTGPAQQYALVMLDEDQVSKLLGNTPMRRLNAPPHAYDPHLRYLRLKRRVAAFVALIVVLGAVSAGWRWAPRPAFAAVFPWADAAAPTVPTAASFSVAVPAPPRADATAGVAGRLRGLALPVFTRRRPDTSVHQVMVGPYVSLDEAEAAQRFLRARGFGGGRLFVDESVRNAPRNESLAPSARPEPGVLLVGAPDRLSLVFELDTQPRRVSSTRTSGTTFELELGPVRHHVRPQQWSAPAGVHLMRHVALQDAGEAAGGGRFVKALVSLPEFSQAAARVDGRRVYIDLTWPQHGAVEVDSSRPATASIPAVPAGVAPATPDPAAGSSDVDTYHEQVAPSLARFEEMTPFLLSAAKSPSPPVLAALSQTLTSLEATLAGIRVPPDAADGHALVTSAVAAARTSMDAEFDGDRPAQAAQAVAMFRGGRAALP